MAVRDASKVISTYHHEGLQLVHRRVALSVADLTAGNQVLLYKFPDTGAFPVLGNLKVYIEDDLDTGATLVWSMGIGDSDGVVDTVLISGSIIGRAAGPTVDEMDANILLPLVDVGGKYLIWNTTGSGTTAGDIELAFMYASNVIKQSN